jgi:hypothetical protein
MKKLLVIAAILLTAAVSFAQGQYYDYSWRQSVINTVALPAIAEENRIIFNVAKATVYDITNTYVSETFNYIQSSTVDKVTYYVYGDSRGDMLFVEMYGDHAIILQGWLGGTEWRTKSVLFRLYPTNI